MKTPLVNLLAAMAFAAVALAAEDKPITVQAMPPSVMKTVPHAGDTAVDPALKEISVTFSKDMKTERMWAICQISNETFPEKGAGDIHYLADKRTCVFPVKLQPGKTYVLWFNRGKFNSFRDTDNNPAVPYLLVFQTKK
ncbi:MAG: Ig-like domain-containing protein [Verrucomicrobia bacterium]|nr:Ig-like domain-containing protein [Verrucomicrobiota bacterium]